MTAQNVGKHGIPVLAYTELDATTPMESLLLFRSNKLRTQATLCLSISLQDFETAPTIVLQYDADNLVPGTLFLKSATPNLPQSRLAHISRSGMPQIQTLSLRLASCCPIWGPLSGSVTPNNSGDVTLNQLANLAKATQLYILLDAKYLHGEPHAILQYLIERPDQLSGFPVARYYKENNFGRLDASVFDIVQGVDHDVVTDDTTEDEEPPPYMVRSLKRPRVGELVLTPNLRQRLSLHLTASSSPTAKRAFLSDPQYVAPSPTEPESIATTSPRPPYNPAASAPGVQEAVDVAVSKLLSSVLAVPLLTAVQTASSPSSPTPNQNSSLSAPPLSPSTLNITMGESIARRFGKELGGFCARMLSEASHIRKEGYAKFSDEVQEKLLELDVMKEDIITEVRCVKADELDSLNDDCEAIKEQVCDCFEEKINMLSDAATERISALNTREKKMMSMDKELLAREKQLLAVERAILDKREQLLRLQIRVHEEQKKLDNVKSHSSSKRDERVGSAPA
jgi:hypothetical protein